MICKGTGFREKLPKRNFGNIKVNCRGSWIEEIHTNDSISGLSSRSFVIRVVEQTENSAIFSGAFRAHFNPEVKLLD